MRLKIDLPINLTLLCSTVFILSCTSLAVVLLPKLEKRTLYISQDKPALEYPYFQCKGKKMLGLCVGGMERKVDEYELTTSMGRERLRELGFRCTTPHQFD